MSELKLPGGTVNYEVIGSGHPLVALHGGPGNLAIMKGLLEPVFSLRAGWQRIYFDLPGNGQTRVDERVNTYDAVLDFVLAFMDALLPDRPVALAGQSYGGYLARGIVKLRPAQILGLCLVVPRIQRDRTHKTVPAHRVLERQDEFISALREGEEWIGDYLVVQTRKGLEQVREYLVPSLDTYDEEFSEQLQAVSPGLTFDVDDLDEPYEGPTLIVTGRQDKMTGFEDGWQLLDRYPRASYIVLDKAGHFLGLVEQRGLFHALLAEWADRVEEAESLKS
jgi:pimeloyl-ACP methyl ester carboxylesterase